MGRGGDVEAGVAAEVGAVSGGVNMAARAGGVDLAAVLGAGGVGAGGGLCAALRAGGVAAPTWGSRPRAPAALRARPGAWAPAALAAGGGGGLRVTERTGSAL